MYRPTDVQLSCIGRNGKVDPHHGYLAVSGFVSFQKLMSR